MNFSDALTAIKHGEKLTRAAWGNANAYVFYVKAHPLERKYTGPWAAEDDIAPLQIEAHLMMCAEHGIVPFVGLARELLADDWEVVR